MYRTDVNYLFYTILTEQVLLYSIFNVTNLVIVMNEERSGTKISAINLWTSTETYTSDLVTAEPEVNIDYSRRGPIITLSETPSKEQHENGTTYQTPQSGPAP
jgi:hypothetical protein